MAFSNALMLVRDHLLSAEPSSISQRNPVPPFNRFALPLCHVGCGELRPKMQSSYDNRQLYPCLHNTCATSPCQMRQENSRPTLEGANWTISTVSQNCSQSLSDNPLFSCPQICGNLCAASRNDSSHIHSYGLGALRYENYQTGPQHVAPWVVIAYIREVEYGRGQARTLAEARERAAANAFQQLYAELSRR
ncbi:hypothetical protein BC835DRAFT_1098814 [Cytidiella melzeri]|nr:hypothetical protein BC835DRAFT_1098814 [Cytidiella melzeri]